MKIAFVKQEPDAVTLNVRICAGGREKERSVIATLVYQIDNGGRRLLFVAQERVKESLA